MSVVWSFVFDKLTDPLDLPLPLWQQWLVLAVIGLIAYEVAFRAVGGMYHRGDISSGFAGSILHWTIRLLVFVAIWAITYGAIVVGRFIYAHWVPILVAIGVLFAISIVVWIISRKRGSNASDEG